MLTYANHWWNAIGSALNLGMTQDDRWLACMPLFHVGGMAILLRSVIYGITAVVHPSFDEHAVNRAIDEDGITIVSVVATMLQRMLRRMMTSPIRPPSAARCWVAVPRRDPCLKSAPHSAFPLCRRMA